MGVRAAGKEQYREYGKGEFYRNESNRMKQVQKMFLAGEDRLENIVLHKNKMEVFYNG